MRGPTTSNVGILAADFSLVPAGGCSATGCSVVGCPVVGRSSASSLTASTICAGRPISSASQRGSRPTVRSQLAAAPACHMWSRYDTFVGISL